MQIRSIIAILVIPCAAACTAEETCTGDWPSASGTVVHVSSKCGTPSGDGSATSPYATIGAALAQAKSGTTVLVGSGTYAESLSVPSGVSIRGAGHTKVTLKPKGGVGVRVEQPGINILSGFAIQGAQSIGLLITKAEVKAVDLSVSGTTQPLGEDGTLQPGGHGIQVTEAASFVAENCLVTGNSGTGVLAQHVGPVSIIDPLFKTGARGSTVSIIDPVFAPTSQIADNAGGGVAIIDPVFGPAGLTDDPEPASPSLILRASKIAGNTGFGVALYGAGASIERSAIQDTKAAAGQDFADGLVMAPAVAATAQPGAVDPTLDVDQGSVVAGNGRAGLLVAARSLVRISAAVASNGLGGCWAQGATSTVRVLPKARFFENSLLGVAATAGASLDIDGATIEGTRAKAYASPSGGMPAQVGDGVAIFNGARARILKAKLTGNARAGILIDGAAVESSSAGQKMLAVEIAGTSFSGGEVGVAVNKSTQGVPSAGGYEAVNTFASVKSNVDTSTQLAARTALCDVGPSHSACDDGNPCTVEKCDAQKGCQYTLVADSTACKDGSTCTFDMVCMGGACSGVSSTCDDKNPCTSDGCDKTGACTHANNAAKCNDGDLCTGFDTCVGGACKGSAKVCDDGDASTLDACDAASGVCGHQK